VQRIFDQINKADKVECSDGRALLKATYQLFVCREARFVLDFWTPREAKEIKYAAI
jgi:hypothetical protein